jgi:RNA-binding protein
VGQSNGSAVGQSIIGGGKISDIPERIKRQAKDRDFQPSVRIGKTGITPNIVEEIRAQLKKRKLVKIKINKGIYERDSRTQVWDYLAEETSAVIVLARGNVGVLWSQS